MRKSLFSCSLYAHPELEISGCDRGGGEGAKLCRFFISLEVILLILNNFSVDLLSKYIVLV
jgi:hypothetical protein